VQAPHLLENGKPWRAELLRRLPVPRIGHERGAVCWGSFTSRRVDVR
jgi:hypothetical protein